MPRVVKSACYRFVILFFRAEATKAIRTYRFCMKRPYRLCRVADNRDRRIYRVRCVGRTINMCVYTCAHCQNIFSTIIGYALAHRYNGECRIIRIEAQYIYEFFFIYST